MDATQNYIDLGPFLTNEFGDRYFYQVNRSAFDVVGSDALYKQILGDNFFQEDALNIVIGTDSGVLLKYVLKHGAPDGSRFLFVELPEVFDRVKESFSLEELGPQIVVTTYEDWQKRAQQLNLTDYIYIGKTVLHKSVGAADAFLTDYHELYQAVHEEMTQLFWVTKATLGTEAFILGQLENLAENRVSSICLENAFKEKTAVLLGGGPSLDEALPWLKANQHRVVILAVSRICRRLMEYGLTPHMVFSVDPQQISFDISKEMFHFRQKSLFVHSYHVSTPLLAQWRGKSIYLGPRLPWETILNVKTFPLTGPTVTNAALSAAVAMGFSQVVLAGVDLCFNREGYTHAKGSNEHKVGPRLGNVNIRVETNGGWMAETSPGYATAAKIFGSQAEHALKVGCKVINSALGASKIPNVSYQPLDEIAIEDMEKPAESIITGKLPVESRETRIAHYQDMLKELARGNGILRKIKELAIEAIKCNEGFFGRKGKSADFKYKKRMDKIENRLNTTYKDFTPLVKEFGLRNFLKIVPLDPEREWDDDDIERTGKIYYESYRNSAGRLIKLVEKAQQRLRVRLEEEKDSPAFDLLIDQWESDRQPGRCLVWKCLHPDISEKLGSETKERLKKFEDAFKKIMEETETLHMCGMKKVNNLSGARSKLTILFTQRDIIELERLVDGLAKNPSPETKPLLHLSRGYIAELEGAVERAIEEYQKLISEKTDKPVLEDALKRITSLSIGLRDIDNGLTALQCLADLSPAYAPQYAEMLRITGDKQKAISVYTSYLSKVPEDSGTMLKLGKLYKELNIDEAAQMAFNYVLEQDPHNRAAKALLESMGETC
ncbi:MAG: DUF115 domain-containing protein [Deltaproteobacteria bacterium]|nr:DUF115 domain-containing protein [Deltaproteobacteria bacterium]